MNQIRYSDTINHDYDKIITAWPYRKELLRTFQRVIRRHFLNAGQEEIIAIEIGSGTGEATKHILKSDKRIKVAAVDIDEVMIQSLESKLDHHMDRIRTIREDALEYMKGLDSNTCDLFSSSWTLHNFEQNKRWDILEEAYRILKPEGLFVAMDKYVPDKLRKEAKLFYLHMQRIMNLDLGLDRQAVHDLIQHEKDDRAPDFKMKEQDAIITMKIIGYKGIKIVQRKERDAVLIAYKI